MNIFRVYMDRGNGREEIGEGYNLGPGEFKIPNNDEAWWSGSPTHMSVASGLGNLRRSNHDFVSVLLPL